jgi:hypothetical protein
VKELFESSLSFIVLAIILSVRFIFFLRKRAAAREAQERRQSQNPPPSPLAGVAAIEDEWAAGSEEEYDDGEFSAWSLSVDSKEPPAPPVPPAAPAALSIDTGFSSQILPSVSLDVPEPVSAISEVWPEDYRKPAPIESDPAAGNVPRANSPFRKKFRTLPSLRQGVILSEILGPPKGL